MSQALPQSAIKAGFLAAALMSGSATAGIAEAGNAAGHPFQTNWMKSCPDSSFCVGDAARYAQADIAAPAAEPAESKPETVPDPQPARPAPPGRFGFDFNLGFAGGSDPQASQPAATHGGRPWGFGGTQYEQSGLRYGFEWVNYTTRYQTPQSLRAQSYGPEMDLEVMGVVGKLGGFARAGPVEIFADGGLGWYFSTMSVSKPSVITFFVPYELEEKSNDFGADWRLGAALHLGPLRLGYEVRRLALNGSFGRMSNNTSMPIGGKFVLMTIGVVGDRRR